MIETKYGRKVDEKKSNPVSSGGKLGSVGSWFRWFASTSSISQPRQWFAWLSSGGKLSSKLLVLLFLGNILYQSKAKLES